MAKDEEEKFSLEDIEIGDPADDAEDGDLQLEDDPTPDSDEKQEGEKADKKPEDSSDENDESDDSKEPEEEPEGDESNDDDEPLVLSILANSGYEFTDEELDGIDDTVESVDKAVDLVATKRANEQFEKEYGKFDDVKEYLEYRKNGGEPEEYFKARSQEVDIASLEIQEDDITTQREIVRENLKAQGYDDEAINEEIAELEETDRLFARSKRNHEVMKQQASKQREELKANQQKKYEEYVNQVNELKTKAQDIRKTSAAPIKLDDDIDNYMYGEDPTEPSPYYNDAQKLTQEQQLIIAQLVRNGVDLSKLVKNEVKTKNAQSLRERLRKARAKGGNQPESENEGDFEIPGLEDLEN